MLAYGTIVALLTLAPAASPGDESPTASAAVESPRTAQQLRDAVHDTLRREATARGAEKATAIRDLAALHREISASTALVEREQRELRTLVRSRLQRVSKRLQKQLAQAAKPPADGKQPRKLPAKDNGVLAQVGNNARQAPANVAVQNANPLAAAAAGGAGGGDPFTAQTLANAQQLVDLIQETIAPSSWQANGGLGTIMYFAPSQVLVIRQTDDIHGQIGGAIRRLRGN